MSFELYLARHGDAVDLGGEITSDGQRHLSKKGEEESWALGKALAKLEWAPKVILTSPLIRARQTAKLVRKALEERDMGVELIESADLEPGATPPRFFKALQLAKGEKRILFVGHQPDLGRFLSFLVSGGSMELHFAIKTGSLAMVEIDDIPLKAAGRLLALMPPRVLDRI